MCTQSQSQIPSPLPCALTEAGFSPGRWSGRSRKVRPVEHVHVVSWWGVHRWGLFIGAVRFQRPFQDLYQREERKKDQQLFLELESRSHVIRCGRGCVVREPCIAGRYVNGYNRHFAKTSPALCTEATRMAALTLQFQHTQQTRKHMSPEECSERHYPPKDGSETSKANRRERSQSSVTSVRVGKARKG